MAFDNDADFVSFTDLGDEPQGTWEVEAAVKDKPTRSQRRRRTPAPTPVPIKGRTAQLKEQDREEEEEGPPDSSFAMDLSFDNDLKTPRGVTVTRIPALTGQCLRPSPREVKRDKNAIHSCQSLDLFQKAKPTRKRQQSRQRMPWKTETSHRSSP